MSRYIRALTVPDELRDSPQSDTDATIEQTRLAVAGIGEMDGATTRVMLDQGTEILFDRTGVSTSDIATARVLACDFLGAHKLTSGILESIRRVRDAQKSLLSIRQTLNEQAISAMGVLIPELEETLHQQVRKAYDTENQLHASGVTHVHESLATGRNKIESRDTAWLDMQLAYYDFVFAADRHDAGEIDIDEYYQTGYPIEALDGSRNYGSLYPLFKSWYVAQKAA